MGTSYNCYIGPYVEYRVSVSVVTEPSCSCNTKKSKFCPVCGKENYDKLVQYEEPEIDAYDDLNEEFSDTDWHSSPPIKNGQRTYRIIPNVRGVGQSIDPRENQILDLPEDTSQDMEEKLAESLKKLRDMCGEKNVVVKCGIIFYTS